MQRCRRTRLSKIENYKDFSTGAIKIGVSNIRHQHALNFCLWQIILDTLAIASLKAIILH